MHGAQAPVAGIALMRDRPVVDPHPQGHGVHTGNAGHRPAHAFVVVKLGAGNVGDGEMTEQQRWCPPGRLAGRELRAVAEAEQCQLKAEWVAFVVAEVAAEIPPLGLEVLMRAVVARELKPPRRDRPRELCAAGVEREQRGDGRLLRWALRVVGGQAAHQDERAAQPRGADGDGGPIHSATRLRAARARRARPGTRSPRAPPSRPGPEEWPPPPASSTCACSSRTNGR